MPILCIRDIFQINREIKKPRKIVFLGAQTKIHQKNPFFSSKKTKLKCRFWVLTLSAPDRTR